MTTLSPTLSRLSQVYSFSLQNTRKQSRQVYRWLCFFVCTGLVHFDDLAPYLYGGMAWYSRVVQWRGTIVLFSLLVKYTFHAVGAYQTAWCIMGTGEAAWGRPYQVSMAILYQGIWERACPTICRRFFQKKAAFLWTECVFVLFIV